MRIRWLAAGWALASALRRLSRRTGVRWDVRYFRGIGSAEGGGTLSGAARLSYWRASMAVVLRTR